MSNQGIRSLPIADISADNSCLFLWTTMPMIPVALSVIEAWGFEYKTVAFVWVKTTKHGKLAWGMGNWTRANSELVLLGIKGKPKRIDAGVHQVVRVPSRGHSRKPVEVRDRIVKLMGDTPRVELFARDKVEGWDAWGNEVENDIEL